MRTIRETIRDLKIRRQTQLSLQDIAQELNPLPRGWIAYYGRYAPSALYPLLRYVNQTLVAWAMRKFKCFKVHKVRASPVFATACRGTKGSLRALGYRYDRRVCLMGAG